MSWELFDPEDVYAALRHREKTTPKFLNQSPQMAERPHLVDWICTVCNRFQLQITTRHLAVTLLDYFMDHYKIDQKQLILLCIACIQISAKYEEMEVAIPRFQDILMLASQQYSSNLISKMELAVIKHFQWNVGIPTAVHYSPYLARKLIDAKDLRDGAPFTVDTLIKTYNLIGQYQEYIQSLLLKDVWHRQHRPSLVSAAIMAAVRKLLFITPVWPDRLVVLTSYTDDDIKGPLSAILGRCWKERIRYAVKGAPGSPDSGLGTFESRSPESTSSPVASTASIKPVHVTPQNESSNSKTEPESNSESPAEVPDPPEQVNSNGKRLSELVATEDVQHQSLATTTSNEHVVTECTDSVTPAVISPDAKRIKTEGKNLSTGLDEVMEPMSLCSPNHCTEAQ